MTTLAPDMAPSHSQADPDGPAPEPAAGPAPAGTTGGGSPQRRPTKFLADLTRAMQAAAEQARAGTLEQFRGDGTAVIEQIHARSATGAAELRRRADSDVATLKDWSKAEIARIRDETERRVGARREQLEGQLERHAALVEHEIEKVRGRLASFEAEMGQFFDSLVGEEDPARFAARAANLPEPPTFDDFDDDAMTALLHEPGLGLPDPVVAQAVETVEAELEPSVDPADVVGEAAPDEPGAGASETPLDHEAATDASQATAEAPAAMETAEVAAETTPSDASITDPQEPDVDPRLAMLGLEPDFAAAEVAAVEMAAAEIEDVPEFGGEALAARLSGLVPAESDAAVATAVTTQVVVTGLVSVASIAGFKRHLGRLPGVGHVGVSSGPDAEFVFAVSHDPATSLRDLIPTLPGFAARIAVTGEGVLHVSAQDPRD
ncbi:MAG TPA: hypothetical protein VLM76_11500 [Patescibacteria group bacterium]|nr:hypothetical protein [Patescibacteria group bacterium]